MKNSESGAFPSNTIIGREDGLTKREYFAALAMQGILASTSNSFSVEQVIDVAITLADKLLSKLEQK